MYRLIDIDQPIFVPIVDESKGGLKYEQQMTIEEFFQKFFDGNVPEIVDAIPVEWMVSWINRHPNDLRCVWFASLEMEWRKEQGAR